MKPFFLLVFFSVLVSLNLQAQGQPSKEEIKKACEAYAAVGDMHKMLAKGDGNWTEQVTMWMDPSAPPTKSTLKVTNKMILGGRYQHSKHEGTMDGKPFEGYSVVGYDNVKKMFQSTWVDNMGTGIMYMEGTYDEPRKMVHYTGKMVDPVSGKEMMCRQEFTHIDDNNEKLVMYMTMPGQQEMKTMEIAMKRDVSKPMTKK